MSIRRKAGEFVCECDDCGDKMFGGTTEEFKNFVEEIEAEGWKIRKDDETWIHICPSCAEAT